MSFDYTLDFANLDFHKHPELYRIGKGEQGVLLVEPYKSELLPHWRFKTPALARSSADKLYAMFLDYQAQEDFVGMDMARKFLQMGYTRARRYANHRSGHKYAEDGKTILPQAVDPEKAASAQIFYEKWQMARTDQIYLALKQRHRTRYEQPGPATQLPQDQSKTRFAREPTPSSLHHSASPPPTIPSPGSVGP